MGTRYFAIALAMIFTIIGLFGFVPGPLVPHPLSGPTLDFNVLYGYLFGLFPVNILNSLIHLGFGIWGFYAFRSYGAAKLYAKVVGIVFSVLAIMGLIPVLNTTFGIMPLFGADVVLHALFGLFGLYFGFVTTRQRVG